MWKIYFFGAGKKGKYWLRCLKEFGVAPVGFIDNNQLLWGSNYEQVPVYAPDRLKIQLFDYVAITCNDGENIYRQLLEMGIEDVKILFGYHRLRNYLFYFATKNFITKEAIMPRGKKCSNQKILFDLQNGMVLGGVEAWSYELAVQLKRQGFEGVYFTTDSTQAVIENRTYPAHIFRYQKCKGERDIIELGVQAIAENLPCTVICNFPQYIFWSTCIAKAMYPEQVRIIAVQHNDDQMYYEAYGLWQEYIDKCLVISSHIESKQTFRGMNRDKMIRIGWQVPCSRVLERTWSKDKFPLQIGYAGRVTVTQKRADLLLEIAIKLRKSNIQFCLNVAGMGNYSETLHHNIKKEGLCDCIKIAGYIERKEISDFWKNQDIMISCSEWEGHSISQVEAMASGAVPVITDVSGARDDVIDGYNGFVVSVGDTDSLVEKICFLYQNRDELEHMGKLAHDTICKRQENNNQAVFWDGLLREVWKL